MTRDCGTHGRSSALAFSSVTLALGSIIAANWIPDTGSFDTVWMWFGLDGFLFIILQLVFINIKLKVNG